MKKMVILTALVSLLISCARGKTEHFPAADPSSSAAEIFIIRDNSLLGWGFSLKVMLDDTVIAHLRAGEYVRFTLAPGFHALGIAESTETIALKANQKHFFLISPDYSQFGFKMNRIGNEQAEYWLARTKPID
jgi:hypothetical protein